MLRLRCCRLLPRRPPDSALGLALGGRPDSARPASRVSRSHASFRTSLLDGGGKFPHPCSRQTPDCDIIGEHHPRRPTCSRPRGSWLSGRYSTAALAACSGRRLPCAADRGRPTVVEAVSGGAVDRSPLVGNPGLAGSVLVEAGKGGFMGDPMTRVYRNGVLDAEGFPLPTCRSTWGTPTRSRGWISADLPRNGSRTCGRAQPP